MSESSEYRERLREFFYYPKLSKEQDSVQSPRTFGHFSSVASAPQRATGLYIHIPFCDYLCYFCPFFKVLTSRTSSEEIARFFGALQTEIRMHATLGGLEGRTLSYIEFGGGTPTSVEPRFIAAVLETVREHFSLGPDCTITMEGDALGLKQKQKVSELTEAGVNRFSFGVQTFDEELRRKIGVKPTVTDIHDAAANVKESDANEFAIDLLYNLPDQTVAGFADDVEQALCLEPDYIDLYSLTLWDNTSFHDRVLAKKGFKTAPTNENNLEMFDVGFERLRSSGYEAVRSYTFARPPVPAYIEQQRHVIVNRGDSIGVGPSSRGYVDGNHYINVSDLEAYCSMLEDGTPPIELGSRSDCEEDARRLMVLFSSMLLRIDITDVPEYADLFERDVDRLVSAGHMQRTGDQLVLTKSGMTWAGNIGREFFSSAQKRKMTEAFVYSLRESVNPYNQDRIGVRRKVELTERKS